MYTSAIYVSYIYGLGPLGYATGHPECVQF